MICASGAGNPASTSRSRVHDSPGDSVRGSTRRTSARACLTPGCRYAAPTSARSWSVLARPACANASSAASAVGRSDQRARSTAVRGGVVNRTPSCSVTAVAGSRASTTRTAGCAGRPRWCGTAHSGATRSRSVGENASIPHTHAAVRPHSTARSGSSSRTHRNRVSRLSGTCASMHTPCSGRRRTPRASSRPSRWRDSPSRAASRPRNGCPSWMRSGTGPRWRYEGLLSRSSTGEVPAEVADRGRCGRGAGGPGGRAVRARAGPPRPPRMPACPRPRSRPSSAPLPVRRPRSPGLRRSARAHEPGRRPVPAAGSGPSRCRS